MKIIKAEQNTWNIKGMTTGKMLAIKHALECAQANGKLGAVGIDVLNVINHTIRISA